MAFVASFKSRLYVGTAAFANFTRGFSFTGTRAMLDTTTLADTSAQFIPGQDSGTASLDLLFDTDTTTGGEFSILTAWKNTPQVVTLAPSGTTRGSEAWLLLGNDASVAASSPVGDVVTASVDITCDGPQDPGVVLEDLTAISANTNGTSTDNGAATANGGVAHLHVTAYSGLTNDTIVLEHSTDNSVFATLGTFATVTGTTSERLVIAAGTTVNRYVRIRDAITGVGTCTRTVSFARR